VTAVPPGYEFASRMNGLLDDGLGRCRFSMRARIRRWMFNTCGSKSNSPELGSWFRQRIALWLTSRDSGTTPNLDLSLSHGNVRINSLKPDVEKSMTSQPKGGQGSSPPMAGGQQPARCDQTSSPVLAKLPSSAQATTAAPITSDQSLW